MDIKNPANVNKLIRADNKMLSILNLEKEGIHRNWTTVRKTRITHLILCSILLCGAILGMDPRTGFASSEFTQGNFAEVGPVGQSFRGPGHCTFITGPRADLEAGHFLLTIDDAGVGDFPSRNLEDGAQLKLTGTFTAAPSDQEFTLYPDASAAEDYFTGVLRTQLYDKYVTFQLKQLDARVKQNGVGRLFCDVGMTGRLSGSIEKPTSVKLAFKGEGLYFAGNSAPLATQNEMGKSLSDSTVSTAASCPTTELAPFGLAPVASQCATPNCLVDFKGYKWWTSYQYYGPNGGYFYNDGLRTAFAPKNAFVDAEGLHLQIAMRNLGGGVTHTGAEVVLMFNSDDSPANLGYGDYLVTAHVGLQSSWATLDPNAAFGVFTYERLGNGSTGATTNPKRELDLAEISRWGWNQSTGSCPYNKVEEKPLCYGNAQFTLQPYTVNSLKNLHRYTIKSDVDNITLVMRWHGPKQPVTFEQYKGAFTFATLPTQIDEAWTTSADQNKYVPETNCERFHLNLWMGNYPAGKGGPNPPPKTLPQEVVVTNFEFKPVQ